MFAVVALASLASVTAFAPTGRAATSSLKMAEPFAGGLAGANGPELKNVSLIRSKFIYPRVSLDDHL
jgi:hypothetical protein